MAKNDHPAFLFYVEDFTSDGIVEAMSTEAVGAYILLLCKAWRESPVGSIPNNDHVLARWSRLAPDRWCECKSSVLAAFTLCADNRWHQKRMRQEYAKLQQKHKGFTERARKAAVAMHSKRKGISNLDATSIQDAPDKQPLSMPRAVGNEDTSSVSLSVVSSSEELRQKTEQVVHSIRARHPAIRTCGPAEIRKQLASIVRSLPKLRKEYPTITTPLELLDLIDRNHELHCQTAKWQEQGGQFARGLANWLAPTEKRYMDPPTQEEVSAVRPPPGGTSKMHETVAALEFRKQIGWQS